MEPEEMDPYPASPIPWVVVYGEDGDWEHGTYSYCEGIKDANNNWVIRFDDDYGTDQAANAELIVRLVNNWMDILRLRAEEERDQLRAQVKQLIIICNKPL